MRAMLPVYMRKILADPNACAKLMDALEAGKSIVFRVDGKTYRVGR